LTYSKAYGNVNIRQEIHTPNKNNKRKIEMSEKTTVAAWNARAIEAAHARGMRSAVEGHVMTDDQRAFYDGMSEEQFNAHLTQTQAEAAKRHVYRASRGVGNSAMTGSGVGAGRRPAHGPAYKTQPGSGR
jgi:hypothetical protein